MNEDVTPPYSPTSHEWITETSLTATTVTTTPAITRASELFTLFQILKGGTLAILVLWTIVTNSLVFIVLYKNPRLQTVPNLLVGNLAFSDLCLAIIVLPLSAIYVLAEEWLWPELVCQIFVSADILCSTASIWNLSIVGLDRYWAITMPVAYMAKRNKATAAIMILSVWSFSTIISFAPLLGWKQMAEHGNLVMVKTDNKWQCTFLDLPSYTIYSATGSFLIPTILMFFVYCKIYQAFARHRARQIYRQKVIRKHIESTILHEISHVLPTSDEFASKEEEEEAEGEGEEDEEGDEDSITSGKGIGVEASEHASDTTREKDDDDAHSAQEEENQTERVVKVKWNTLIATDAEPEADATTQSQTNLPERRKESRESLSPPRTPLDSPQTPPYSSPASDMGRVEPTAVTATVVVSDSSVLIRRAPLEQSSLATRRNSSGRQQQHTEAAGNHRGKQVTAEKTVAFKRQRSSSEEEELTVAAFRNKILSNINNSAPLPPPSVLHSARMNEQTGITYEKIKRHKQRRERKCRRSLQNKPKAISAAKERRGVKVLGIILGAYCCCWTPFFIMYLLAQFCSSCKINPHIEMFITWLGYSNSAINPIIYTVFNRDYQIALKRLFTKSDKRVLVSAGVRPNVL